MIDRPIIVIGAPRSGTTILRHALALHQDVWHLPGESHEVLEGPCHPSRSGYSSNRVVSVPDEVAESMRAEFASRALNLNRSLRRPERVLSARTVRERAVAKLAVRLAGVRSGVSKPARIRFLEKTPKNSLRVPLMAQLFPDAFWVYVTRRAEPNIASLVEGWHAMDGIGPFSRPRFASSAYPIAESLALSDYDERWWKFALPPGWEHLHGSSVVEVAAWQYQECNRLARDDLGALDRPARHVKHEDFVDDPVGTVRSLFEWAELEPSPTAERFAASLPRVNTVAKHEGAAARRDAVRALIDASPRIRALEAELGYPPVTTRRSARAEPVAPKSKLVYIAGYGRSGSTALATILSGHPQVVAVGEATFLADDWDDPTRPCSCGQPYGTCDFWGELRPDPAGLEAIRSVVRDIDRHVLRSWWRGPGRATGPSAADYGMFTRAVNDFARRRSGRPIVLDSSKSARGAAARAVALRRFAGEDVYLIHLVRGGMASVDSMVTTGSNWVIEGHARPGRLPAVRASVGWVRANLCAVGARMALGAERSLQLSYDELIAHPAAALAKIGDLLDLDMSSVARQVQDNHPFPVGHVVGGNRIRKHGEVELWSRPVTRPRLSRRVRATFLLLGGWLEWTLRRADRTTATPDPAEVADPAGAGASYRRARRRRTATITAPAAHRGARPRPGRRDAVDVAGARHPITGRLVVDRAEN